MIKDTFIYKYFAYRVHKYSVEKNPVDEINRYYLSTFGRKADLDNPKSLIEKIYWMQLHCDTSKWSLFADKYRMRSFVEEKGYGAYLPKLYGKWDNPTDIDADSLPQQFVLKTNNGCATVLIIKDKNTIDWEKTKKQLNRWIKIPFGYSGFEPHYLSIKPCVIAEELLQQDVYLNEISPKSMVDFKFWCFNGHVESCFVAYNRVPGNLTVDLYDSNWNRLVQCLRNNGEDRFNPDVMIEKPKCFEKMKEIASSLSKGQPQMRVDFYSVNGEPVIGELTMSSGYGYFTDDYYNYLGGLVNMNLLKRIK